jgi:hypothetical protein
VKPLDFVYVIAILSAVVAAPFMLIGWSNYFGRRPEDRVFPVKSTLFFAVPVLVGLLAAGISTLIAQCEVAEFLASVSDRYTISIDGRLTQNRQQVLDTLKQFTNLPAHHSSPTRELHVDISDPPRHLQLSVARDSSDPHEYWLFAPSPSKFGIESCDEERYRTRQNISLR